MAQTATLHIKIDPKIAKSLKAIAIKRKQTVGELVRYAVIACYQPAMLGLPQHQKDALSAYRGRYISIGKLAEEMGMHVITLRKWLQEHDIPQNNVFEEDDVTNIDSHS